MAHESSPSDNSPGARPQAGSTDQGDTESFYRSEAIDYHHREAESIGILPSRPRWGWAVIAVSAVLLTATVVYVFLARHEILRLLEGRASQ